MCGTAKYLKEQNPSLYTVGIDTYGSVFKKYKETGIFDKNEIYPYITEGIGEDFLPANVDFNIIALFEHVLHLHQSRHGGTGAVPNENGFLAGDAARHYSCVLIRYFFGSLLDELFIRLF